MRQRWLVLMVKEPRPGRVKTRLGREIGHVAAARWFRDQALRRIRDLRDPRWTLVLAVSPDQEGINSRVWPGDIPRMPQGRGNLGDRMLRIFQTLPKGPAIIIGADIPGITRARIAWGFRDLGRHGAVVGPAVDGGYWLIGLKRNLRPAKSMFEHVRWSTEHALSDTLGRMTGMRVAFLDELADVDTAADLPTKNPAGAG
jgi:rSAM/selenodomain-associated transferase 1